MARDPKTDQAMLDAVLMHAQNRDWQRARAIASEALASGIEHPLVLNVLATCLEHESKFVDALVLLERAVAMAARMRHARAASHGPAPHSAIALRQAAAKQLSSHAHEAFGETDRAGRKCDAGTRSHRFCDP
jgi:hypothetical protein